MVKIVMGGLANCLTDGTPAGTVIGIASVRLVVMAHCASGFEGGQPAYVCRQIVPVTAFTEHDLTERLVGNTLLLEGDWVMQYQTLDIDQNGSAVNLAVAFDPFYLPEGLIEGAELLGFLTPATLDRVEDHCVLALIEEWQHSISLTEEDLRAREAVRNSAMHALEGILIHRTQRMKRLRK